MGSVALSHGKIICYLHLVDQGKHANFCLGFAIMFTLVQSVSCRKGFQ